MFVSDFGVRHGVGGGVDRRAKYALTIKMVEVCKSGMQS